MRLGDVRRRHGDAQRALGRCGRGHRGEGDAGDAGEKTEFH
jgi:hypothetical protein